MLLIVFRKIRYLESFASGGGYVVQNSTGTVVGRHGDIERGAAVEVMLMLVLLSFWFFFVGVDVFDDVLTCCD